MFVFIQFKTTEQSLLDANLLSYSGCQSRCVKSESKWNRVLMCVLFTKNTHVCPPFRRKNRMKCNNWRRFFLNSPPFRRDEFSKLKKKLIKITLNLLHIFDSYLWIGFAEAKIQNNLIKKIKSDCLVLNSICFFDSNPNHKIHFLFNWIRMCCRFFFFFFSHESKCIPIILVIGDSNLKLQKFSLDGGFKKIQFNHFLFQIAWVLFLSESLL